MSKESFLRAERLKKNNDIKAVLDKGVFYKSGLINVYILKKPETGVNKAAFICKKVLHQKKTVLRNRMRRILKEAYRKTSCFLSAGNDIVIIATKTNKETLSTAIERELISVFKKYSKK